MSLSGCATFQPAKQNSGNLEYLSMNEEVFLDAQKSMSIRLVWDETMAKGNNIAVLQITGNYRATSATLINVNVDDTKYWFKPNDAEANTSTDPGEANNADNANGDLTLYFNLPDAVVLSISKSGHTTLAVDLADKKHPECSVGGDVKSAFGAFYHKKNRTTLDIIGSKIKTAFVELYNANDNSKPEGNADPAAQPPATGEAPAAPTVQVVAAAPEALAMGQEFSAAPEANPAPEAATAAKPAFISVAARAHVRKTPSASSSIVKTLKRGDRVKFLARENDWYMIEFANGKIGWCHKSNFVAQQP